MRTTCVPQNWQTATSQQDGSMIQSASTPTLQYGIMRDNDIITDYRIGDLPTNPLVKQQPLSSPSKSMVRRSSNAITLKLKLKKLFHVASVTTISRCFFVPTVVLILFFLNYPAGLISYIYKRTIWKKYLCILVSKLARSISFQCVCLTGDASTWCLSNGDLLFALSWGC